MDDYVAHIAGRLRDLAAHAHTDLTVAQAGASAIDALRQQLETERRRARALEMSGRVRADEKLREALRNIAQQETPGANATVQRMARLAREAL
jgi:hypothetical protein